MTENKEPAPTETDRSNSMPDYMQWPTKYVSVCQVIELLLRSSTRSFAERARGFACTCPMVNEIPRSVSRGSQSFRIVGDIQVISSRYSLQKHTRGRGLKIHMCSESERAVTSALLGTTGFLYSFGISYRSEALAAPPIPRPNPAPSPTATCPSAMCCS